MWRLPVYAVDNRAEKRTPLAYTSLVIVHVRFHFRVYTLPDNVNSTLCTCTPYWNATKNNISLSLQNIMEPTGVT